MASAGSTILVLFDGAVIAANVIAFTPEVTCMTAGAERCVAQLIRIIATVDTTTD